MCSGMRIRSGSRSLTDIICFFFWIHENILSKFYENSIKGSHPISYNMNSVG